MSFKQLFILMIFTVFACSYTTAQTTLHVDTFGRLEAVLAEKNIQADTLTKVKLTGSIDARDFEILSSAMQLEYLDIEAVSVTDNTIPATALKGLSKLHTVVLPSSLTEIKLHAFADCTSLTSINIPNTVKYIGDRAFKGIAVSTLQLPDSLRYVSAWAFQGCNNLTSVHIPKRTRFLYIGVFAHCERLEEITVDPDSKTLMSIYGVLYSKAYDPVGYEANYGSKKDGDCLVQYPTGRKDAVFQIPPQVRVVAKQAFRGSPYLKEVHIPDSVFLHSLVFDKCPALETIKASYSSYWDIGSIPRSVKNIYITGDKMPTPLADAMWLYGANGGQTDFSKITLYVHPSLIETYKKTDGFGPKFNYVGWVASSVEQVNKEEQLTIVPNPVRDVFTVKGIESVFTFTVTDMQGKEILHGTTAADSPIYVGQLEKGAYLLTIRHPNKQISTKFLKL